MTAVAQGIQKAEARTKPEQIAADIPWLDTATALEPAAAGIAALAEKSDLELLAKNWMTMSGEKTEGQQEQEQEQSLATSPATTWVRPAKYGYADAVVMSSTVVITLPAERLNLLIFGVYEPMVKVHDANRGGMTAKDGRAGIVTSVGAAGHW